MDGEMWSDSLWRWEVIYLSCFVIVPILVVLLFGRSIPMWRRCLAVVGSYLLMPVPLLFFLQAKVGGQMVGDTWYPGPSPYFMVYVWDVLVMTGVPAFLMAMPSLLRRKGGKKHV
ncbi:hypothetical protein ACLNGM_19190 [Aureimonas phyllosphaerae]|uniref:hypothetical protein n=1 Tax=Aureimonas phyllosphaerae TaxID=1166078 RepID=UPI003A5C7301